MNKIIEIKHKSVLPIYGLGLTWLVGSLLLPVYRLSGLLIVAGLSLLVFALLKSLCPPQIERVEVPITTGDQAADEIIKAIGENRKRLKEINDRIPDDALSAAIARMETACDGILNQLEEHPNQAKELRRFTNHYLPDAVKVLDLYAEMDEKGVTGENSQDVRRQVEENAEVIATAFENQLDGMYASRALDIGTDLEVLKGMLKGQGLV